MDTVGGMRMSVGLASNRQFATAQSSAGTAHAFHPCVLGARSCMLDLLDSRPAAPVPSRASMSPMVAGIELEFGPFRINRQERRLTREGRDTPLLGRAFDLLWALATAGGEPVTKDNLLRAVWPGLTVDENNLHQQVSTVRKALGDGAIITIPGRGYRLALATPGLPSSHDASDARGHPVVGVLPFACHDGDAALRAFADGAAHDVAAALSRVRTLVVIPPPLNPALPKAAARLGLRYIVEGAVRGAGRQVRASARLVEVRNGALLWAESFDGTTEETFTLLDRLSARVAAMVPPRLVAAEIERLQHETPGSSRSYDLLLGALAKGASRSRAGMEQAIRLLRQAVARDPDYALAHAHLASLLWLMVAQGWSHASNAEVADMLEVGTAALALDANHPEILLLVSPLMGTRATDLDRSIAMVEQSIQLNPNSAASWRMLGLFQAYAGDINAALANQANADKINPMDRGVMYSHGSVLSHFFAGDHEAVVDSTSKLLLGLPDFIPALRYRAASLGRLGRVDEGRRVVRGIRDMAPGFTIAWARRHFELDQNNMIKTPGAQEAFYQGLRLAGVPEG